ncbi:MAG: isochorismatase family protein [Desulfuromonadales bacterium]|nr:isochorismatase family protein [Desulfuromonadales bacterium]
MPEKAALLIVDVQNDFCPGGALQIRDGDKVIAPINRAAQLFRAASLPVIASRDWHPPQTHHFREFGGDWPVHCVAGTAGAEFHADLQLPEGTVILSKGVDPTLDGYSAFEAVSTDGRQLSELLTELGVQRLYIGGLATDYCVLTTALDARQRGLAVTVLTDAIAAVELFPGDTTAALAKMTGAGAQFAAVAELPDKLQPQRQD